VDESKPLPGGTCFASPITGAGELGGTLSSLYKMHPTLPEHVMAGGY
jgi:hypothetical protein